jgi:FAD:protein FMN transferase
MRLCLLLLLSLSLLSCTNTEPLYTSQSYVFGTLVDISIYGETETKAQNTSNSISKQFQSLHQRLHAWQSSELSELNTAFAQGQSKVIAADLANMLLKARDLAKQSDGLFNPAIGQLIGFWGFQNDEFQPIKIDQAKITNLVKNNPQMTDIKLDNLSASSSNPNVKLDLGGYAKGYALDLGFKILQQQGVKNALINIGGNVIAKGQHGGKAWRVGIQHPRKPNPIAALDLPDGWAIGTSGDYQRFFMLDGKRYCHIIDPRTGSPAQGTQSVTVLIPPQENAGVLSDVSSKPIFIAAADKKEAYAKKMGVTNFMIILDNGQIVVSQAMLKRLQWLDHDAQKQLKVVP